MEHIVRYAGKGMDHADWYRKESLRLMELLPEFAGLPIIRAFAVTSMSTTIEANVQLALKALLQYKHGEPFHGFLPNQILYLNQVFNGQDVKGRKIMSFIRALEGDKNAVVVDIWMCRAFKVIKPRKLPDGRDYYRAPNRKEYDFVEDKCKYFAGLWGLEPRQVQSCIWAGTTREKSIISKNVSWSDLLIKKRGMFQYD